MNACDECNGSGLKRRPNGFVSSCHYCNGAGERLIMQMITPDELRKVAESYGMGTIGRLRLLDAANTIEALQALPTWDDGYGKGYRHAEAFIAEQAKTLVEDK